MIRLTLLACVLAAALAPPAAGAPPPSGYPSEEALLRYVLGRWYEENGATRDALGEYFRTLALDARSSAAMRRVSELAGQLGEPLRSLELSDRALGVDSTDARAWWLRGTALFALERYDESLAACQASVASDSDHVEYWRTLGRVAEEVERYDEAARAWAHVTLDQPDDGEAWFQLGASQARLGRFGAAREALSEAEEAAPARPGLGFLKGWVAEGLDEPKQAIAEYAAHLTRFPSDGAARRRLVPLLAREGRFEEALREARAIAVASPGDADAYEVLAALAFETKREAEARDALRRLEALGPDEPANLDQRVGVLVRAGRGEEAVKLASEWTARRPGDVRGMLSVARAQALASKPDAAVATLQRAIAAAPDSLRPRLLLGSVLQDARRYEEARDAWQAVIDRWPGELAAGVDLAVCHERLGDRGAAERVIRGVLEHHPGDPTANNFLGYMLAEDGRDLAEAERRIRLALDHQPHNGAFVDSMGWVYYRLGRLEDARRELERAVALTGGDAVVHDHLGDVYRDLKLTELAREQYRKSLSADPANARVRAKLDRLH